MGWRGHGGFRLPIRGGALVAVGLVWALALATQTPRRPLEWKEDRFGLVDALSAATTGGGVTVGLVGSDYPDLPSPVPRDRKLTVEQVEDMVREAVDLAGGLDLFLPPDAERVVIKPNIVELKKRGSGVITDWRVVRALVLIVHETAPQARITIAEGAAWIPPDQLSHAGSSGDGRRPGRGEVGDGFAIAGYRALLQDPELADIDLDLLDLNFDEAEPVEVPGGGYVFSQYYIPRTILEADFVISVPVLKIIAAVGMTNAMKNFVGIAPGMYYGWPKMRGRPDLGIPGLPHLPGILDEVIVDLASEAQPDFAVVDAIVGMERGKSDRAGGRPRRLDAVLASADIVAADAASAMLIGLNPADIEYLSLAARKGLGENDPARIRITGSPLEHLAARFEKTPSRGGFYGEWGHYGQGCRTWLLAGPFHRGSRPNDGEFIDVRRPDALPGQNGWSPPVYFHDDKIDLARYFHDPENCVVYACSDFFVPQAQNAELWVGSDEDLRVWIDGRPVYSHQGNRRHHLPNDRVPLKLTVGWNQILVRADQTGGRFGFSLNICEVEPDPRYDGNRVWGLQFAVRGSNGQPVAPVTEVFPSWSKGFRPRD